MEGWRQRVTAAVRDARMRVIGESDIANEAQATTVLAALKAFGDSGAGLLYVEPATATSTRRPADLVVCHPELGVLVVEVKGWIVDQIERVEAGSFYRQVKGFVRPENPFNQVRAAMFDIKNQVENARAGCGHSPLFTYMLAFPNIRADAWTA